MTSTTSLSHLCSFSSVQLLLPGGAEACPTIPPTQHRMPHTPDTARRSDSEAPATLTCWSDPDPQTTEGASPSQGAPTTTAVRHMQYKYLTAVGWPFHSCRQPLDLYSGLRSGTHFSPFPGNPSPIYATIKDCSPPTTVDRLVVTAEIHPPASPTSEGCALGTPTVSLPPPTLTSLSDADPQANKDTSQGDRSNQHVHAQEDTPRACSLAVSSFPAGLSCKQCSLAQLCGPPSLPLH